MDLMHTYNTYMDGSDKQRRARANLGLKERGRIVYFSLEHGLSEWLSIYGGGLGILSGDTEWGASDRYAKDTFVAVGLAYRTGYFEQHIVTEEDKERGYYLIGEGEDQQKMRIDVNIPAGSQVEYYKNNEFEKYGEIVKGENGEDMVIKVEATPGKFIYAKVWKVAVGRAELYLLDTDIQENDFIEKGGMQDAVPFARALTSNLYARGKDDRGRTYPRAKDRWRFRQELVLGVGGVRAIQAMGLNISTLHMNEGHSALAGIELIRQELERKAADAGASLRDLQEEYVTDKERIDKFMREKGITFDDAIKAVRKKIGFTSHTPVPAGNEEFEVELFWEHFDNYIAVNNLDIGDNISARHIEDISTYESKTFGGRDMVNMSKMALTLSGYSNAVSKKHAEVSRELYGEAWKRIHPNCDQEGYEDDYITNSVHRRSWQAREIQVLLAVKLKELQSNGVLSKRKEIEDLDELELRTLLNSITEEEMLNTKTAARDRCLKHLKETRGVELDGDAFTIVIARRAAPYKRLDLILPKLDMLLKEAEDLGIKVQIVFAGKAHPDDGDGKNIIRWINNFAKSHSENVFFVENYNIMVANDLINIASVWLNNPIPPQEASGTSGMKAALNGVLSVSTPDGWVLEATNAWNSENNAPVSLEDIKGGALLFNEGKTDDETRENMFGAVTKLMHVFAKDKPEWADISKKAIWDSMAHFTMERFVRQYEERMYAPAIQERLVAGVAPFAIGASLSFAGSIVFYSYLFILTYLTFAMQKEQILNWLYKMGNRHRWYSRPTELLANFLSVFLIDLPSHPRTLQFIESITPGLTIKRVDKSRIPEKVIPDKDGKESPTKDTKGGIFRLAGRIRVEVLFALSATLFFLLAALAAIVGKASSTANLRAKFFELKVLDNESMIINIYSTVVALIFLATPALFFIILKSTNWFITRFLKAYRRSPAGEPEEPSRRVRFAHEVEMLEGSA
ncbi:MAG: alpha-glucan family phosphorylase, partial [Candidatus Omnitrophota bacterium]